jgi:acetoin utilization deacetylase AcuC-like enzyme
LNNILKVLLTHPSSSSSGGTLLAAKLALEKGLACNTGGGTHHAFAGHGSGYCLINDMAVTAAALIHQKAVDRVLIVDLDVHQVCVSCGHKLFCCFNFVYLH